MKIRAAGIEDAAAMAAIYAPVVRDSCISFETEAPDALEMRARIEKQAVAGLPWLACEAGDGTVVGYAYAGRHRERAAYQWAVDTSVYVDADSRGQGVGRRLYGRLLPLLAELGYYQAFCGIALPNAASVALHESMGFTPLGVFRKVGFKHGAWHDVGWWQRPLRPLEKPGPVRTLGSG